MKRPDKLNALSPEMMEEFDVALRQLGENDARRENRGRSGITGEEAVALGWANHAAGADECIEFTSSMASAIARTPRKLLALNERALNRVMDSQGFTESLLTSAEFHGLPHNSRAVSDVRAMVESDHYHHDR
ncbi:MAG: hypothetical protein J2P29_07225 [Actinobacteria bacterium]|nr:hypothetical protein [Actinomycetota bacterium]